MNQQNEPEVKDNVEEFGIKVLSAEEQKKIMLQISEEESFNLQNIQSRELDAVFVEDDPEKALDKLLSLHKENLLERQHDIQSRTAYAKHLSELILLIGNEAQRRLTEIINELITDSDEMKKILILQLRQLTTVLDHSVTKQHILPALMQLVKYHNYDVQAESSKDIAIIAAFLSQEERNELIMNIRDDSSEESKMITLQLFGATAHLVPKLEQFIANEILNAGEDVSVRVRKEAIYQLQYLTKFGNDFLTNKLMPFYIQKSEDKSSWHVRKACAEIIVKLSQGAPQDIKEKLSNKMLDFLKDTNKWVKAAAYLQLGFFIDTLRTKPNEQLLNEYCKSTNKEICEYFSSDQEIYDACAATFHLVADTFGTEKWPSLFKLLQTLVKNKGVRRILADNLHLMAKACGPRFAEKDLVAVLDQFLKDPTDEVKYSAISHLWEFIKIFDEEKRENLLDVVLIIQRDQKKWRIRQLIAKQIKHLVPLYSIDNVFQIIVPITLKLCNDIVAAVRKQAAKEMHSILQTLSNDDETSQIYYQCLCENIKAYGISHRYNQRQAFAYMCSKLMILKDFEKTFLDQFVELGHDPVKNVRITVALIIQKRFKQGHLKQHPKLITMIENLKRSSDSEVHKILV